MQDTIDNMLVRRSLKGIYGPTINKKLLIFIDDIQMPKKEEYGAQPPIELLRQLVDQYGYYNKNEKSKPFKTIQDLMLLGSMGNSEGQELVTPRFTRHMRIITFFDYDEVSLIYIYNHILEWFW